MKPIDVSSEELRMVRQILGEHVPELEVRAYGSRVVGSARATSDLDLVLMTDAPLAPLRLAVLRDAFSESALPFKVDLADWAVTKPRFRQIIERQYVVLQDASSHAVVH